MTRPRENAVDARIAPSDDRVDAGVGGRVRDGERERVRDDPRGASGQVFETERVVRWSVE